MVLCPAGNYSAWGQVIGDRSLPEDNTYKWLLCMQPYATDTAEQVGQSSLCWAQPQVDEWDIKAESGQQHKVKALMQYDCTHFLTAGFRCAHIFVARSQEGPVTLTFDL